LGVYVVFLTCLVSVAPLLLFSRSTTPTRKNGWRGLVWPLIAWKQESREDSDSLELEMGGVDGASASLRGRRSLYVLSWAKSEIVFEIGSGGRSHIEGVT